MWRTPEKTHAWFKAALVAFPSAAWIGKTEDDAIIWPSALLTDLAAVSTSTDWYGQMHWQGSCRHQHVTAMADCSGCYGGALQQGPSICRPVWCKGKGSSRCCQLGCPHAARMTPFALGALDVRRRSFAAAIAHCAYAERFFRSVSEHSVSLASMCATTDGSQGHAVGECVENVRMADATARHIDGTRACAWHGDRRCAEGQVAVLHPLKKSRLASWNSSWHRMTQQHTYSPSPLLEAEVVSPTGTTLPRLTFLRELRSDLAKKHPNWTGAADRPMERSAIEHVWARRAAALAYQLTMPRRDHGFVLRSSATRRDHAGKSMASTPRQRRRRLQRRLQGRLQRRLQRLRRLRQASWSVNCSLQWSQGRAAVLEQFVRDRRASPKQMAASHGGRLSRASGLH